MKNSEEKDKKDMRLISKNEAFMLRENGYGEKVHSTHKKKKKYYVEERCAAEHMVVNYRKDRNILNK